MGDQRKMFYGANPVIFARAKKLRLNMTRHEILLWEELRSNKVLTLRFKAQHPIDTFIADFYCHKMKLVIEIDGENHNSADQKIYDENRSSIMEEYGLTTLRFKNREIENDLSKVVEIIKEYCLNNLGNDQK